MSDETDATQNAGGGAPMTPAEFAAIMRRLAESGDPEEAHVKADDLMLALLRSLGYGEGADAFDAMTKWYA